jgi:hypothetical protein
MPAIAAPVASQSTSGLTADPPHAQYDWHQHGHRGRPKPYERCKLGTTLVSNP